MAENRQGKEISPEEYFLNYAYPCIANLLQKKTLSKKDADKLTELLFKKKKINRDYLESCFPEAFRRIREVAQAMGKDYWDLVVLKKYWLEEHNNFIDSGDGEYSKATASFKELCKVYRAQVISRKSNVLTIQYDAATRNVFSTLLPNAKKGDKVTVHLAFAIEKLE